MKRQPHVIWVGTAKYPALAVWCSNCNAEMARPCKDLTPPAFHRAREEYAETLGFRAVAPAGPLFTPAEMSESA